MTTSDKMLSLLRTVTAGAVAWALTWAAVHGHIVLSPHDSDVLTGAVFVIVLAGYHAGASALQRRWPGWQKRWPVLRAGWWLVALLLGSARQPVGYVSPATAGTPIRIAGR